MKKIALSLLMAATVITGCAAPSTKTSADTKASKNTTALATTPTAEKIPVATSFNPIDKLVQYIGGDRVQTTMFVPAGVEPHDYEPTPKDMARLKGAKVLFINGFDMEHWVDSSITKQTKLMNLSEGIDPIRLDDHDKDHDHDHDHDHDKDKDKGKDKDHDHDKDKDKDKDKDHDHDHGHKHGEFDPHIWLGMKELRLMAKNTATALTMVSPQDKVYFEENLAKFNKEADALDQEYLPQFKPYAGKSFITGHEAFGYLCRNLNLKQQAVEGPFAEGEPTPQKIKALVDHVKAEKISTIFVEELASPKVSETLARETGAKTVQINTLEAEGDLFPTLKDIYQKVLESFKK